MMKNRLMSILLTLCMVLTLWPATALAAVESLLPNDPNYVELNQVSDFYKKMQNRETFNGVIYLKGCPSTKALKSRIENFRKTSKDTIYGAEVNRGSWGYFSKDYLKPVVYNINELTGERMYPKTISVAMIFRVENGVLVRASSFETPEVTAKHVWLGETENLPGELSPILPKDKFIKGLTVNSPTREQITAMWKKLGLDRELPVSYEVAPVKTAPYGSGKLPAALQTEALNTVNFIRYMAGIDYNVTLNNDYIQYAQDSALLSALNGKISHTPAKPAGIGEALYQSGCKGAPGNQATASTIPESIWQYMSDYGDANKSVVGHRRWVLNPKMSQTGFGHVAGNKYGFNTMYAHDTKNKSAKYEGVVWPAQNTPIEYFKGDQSWSISFDKDLPMSINNTHINVTRLNDGKEWGFSNVPGIEFYDGILYPYTFNEGSPNGQKNCLVFSLTDIKIGLNEVYRVRVNDSKSNTYFQYFVTFFSLNNVNTALTSDSELVPAKTPAEFDLGTALKPARKTDPSQYPKPLPAPGTPKESNVTGVTLNHTAANLTVGETVKLTVTRTPAGAEGRLVFDSSDKEVATVASSGIVTGKKAGTATITAKIGEVSASCTVTVAAASGKSPANMPSPAPTEPPANTLAPATGEGIKILAYPAKTDYKLGEIFDTTGLNVINCVDGKETNVNGKITFFIQKINGVQLTEKSKFAVTGKKIVELRFEGKKIGTYTINVTKDSAPAKPSDSSAISSTITDIDPSTLDYGLNILSVPSKTAYVVGEGFDKTGVRAVNKHRDGKVVDETDKIKFFTSGTVELTQGRPFTTAGTKVVELRHATSGVKWAKFTITVSEKAVETSSAPSKAVKILANPSKTAYKLGEGFDTTGLQAVMGAGDSQTNINNKITFYTSKTVQLTPGRKFTTTGTKVVEIRYDGQKVSAYTITVTK